MPRRSTLPAREPKAGPDGFHKPSGRPGSESNCAPFSDDPPSLCVVAEIFAQRLARPTLRLALL
jgi:hypothetical protein